jgi:NADH-quinone oxidoreductase subunit C
VVKSESLIPVATYLKGTPEYDFKYLNYVTAVDFPDHLEAVYQLTSLEHNHSIVMKTTCPRENAVLPSAVGLWKTADYQEREIYDLMGIRFEGHPNMRRIVLWEGFQGHPLRKDFNGAQD